MNRFTFIDLSWTCYSGLIFEFFHIDSHKFLNLDSSLFGFNVSKDFLYVDIFYKTFTIFIKKTYDK